MKRKIGFIFMALILLVSTTGTLTYADEMSKWDQEGSTGEWVLKDDGLTASASGNNQIIRSTEFEQNGKWYWEVTLNEGAGVSIQNKSGNDLITLFWAGIWKNGNYVLSKSITFSKGDVVGVALDLDSSKVTFYHNGNLIGSVSTNEGDEYAPALFSGISSSSVLKVDATANFGMKPFKYTVPDSFKTYDGNIDDKLTVLLVENEKIKLSPTIEWPSDRTIEWSTTNSAIATVDSDGLVTALKVGEAIIVAKDGSLSDYIKVKVVADDEISELRLSIELEVGKSARLYLNDDFDNIVWTTVNTDVATISQKGKVTAVSEGLTLAQAVYKEKTYTIYVKIVK